MCGIVGRFNRSKPISAADESQMGKVLQTLAYRGPDGYGVCKSQNALLAHRRLSIIDLSEAGAQPFQLPELGLVITFNGEIYNYKELRETLIAHGYAFRSHSDTEVILYAYDHYGMDFLSHLRGMFAFCLLDQKRNVAVLARDPAGEKPLYYYRDSASFLFASEIKTFHAFDDLDLSIDVESVKAFFVLQYIPGPHTVYRHVRRLSPGCALQLNLDTWEMQETRYWSLFDANSTPTTPDEIEHLLLQSVHYRLVADVEVGLLLSGGIDSALLASCAAQLGTKLRAFTARFDEKDLDESKYARQVTDQLGLQQISITGGEVTPEVFDRVIFHADELLGDPACIPTFLLAQEIGKHVKVVLSGEGADELFWGYDTYRFEKLWHRFAWIHRLTSQAGGLQSAVSRWEGSNRASPMLTRLGKVLAARYNLGAARWTSVFHDHSIEKLVPAQGSPAPMKYLQEIEGLLGAAGFGRDRLDASLSVDLLYWLPDDLLMKVDRMTMAHGVEARAPYLDAELIRKAMALPARYKLRGKSGKFVLRQLVEKHFAGDVGRSLAWRRKHGLEVPIHSWLRQNLRECVEDRLSPRKLASSGLLDVKFVTGLKESFFASPAVTPLRRKLWMLLCFQSWYEMHQRGFGFR